MRATLTHTTQLPPTIGLSFFRLHRVCPINQSRQFSQCIAFGQHFLLFFSLTECQSPTFVDTLRGPDNGGLTHTRTLAWDIQPTQRPPSKDPPRLSCFWRRRRRLRSLCVFPPVLLTLDHWTKIDSPLLVLFSCLTFPLFYTFCVCFSTAPHTQLASLSTPFPFVSLIRQSSSPGGYSLLQQILHLNSTTSNCCPTVHTPFGTCVLAAAPLLLPLSSVASQVAKVQSGWHHQQLLHVVQIDSRVGCSMKLGAPDDDRRTKRTGEIDLSQRFAHTSGRSGTWLGFRHVAFSRQ